VSNCATSSAGRDFDGYGPAHQLGQVPHDRQAEAGAAVAATSIDAGDGTRGKVLRIASCPAARVAVDNLPDISASP
jgi:hypothetical protein